MQTLTKRTALCNVQSKRAALIQEKEKIRQREKEEKLQHELAVIRKCKEHLQKEEENAKVISFVLIDKYISLNTYIL